jgi:hypothetical protein
LAGGSARGAATDKGQKSRSVEGWLVACPTDDCPDTRALQVCFLVSEARQEECFWLAKAQRKAREKTEREVRGRRGEEERSAAQGGGCVVAKVYGGQ